MALGFARVTTRGAGTVKGLGFAQRDILERLDKLKELAIRRLAIEIVSLVTNRVAHSALHSMIIVVEHFAEGPAINHRLVTLEAWPLFALEGFDRDRTKLNAFHRLPWLLVSLQNLNP